MNGPRTCEIDVESGGFLKHKEKSEIGEMRKRMRVRSGAAPLLFTHMEYGDKSNPERKKQITKPPKRGGGKGNENTAARRYFLKTRKKETNAQKCHKKTKMGIALNYTGAPRRPFSQLTIDV